MDRTWSPALQANSLPSEPPEKPKNTEVGSLSLLQWSFPTQESNWGLLVAVHGLLIVVASLVVEYRFSCSAACGIFPDKG